MSTIKLHILEAPGMRLQALRAARRPSTLTNFVKEAGAVLAGGLLPLALRQERLSPQLRRDLGLD